MVFFLKCRQGRMRGLGVERNIRGLQGFQYKLDNISGVYLLTTSCERRWKTKALC